MNYLLVFFVSFGCILLELFWTKILNLKAWNHVVYTVIPFAILGYGIGANIHLLWNKKFSPKSSRRTMAVCLLILAVLMTGGTYALIHLPLNMAYILNIFTDMRATGMLLLAYTIFMLPFILIGFIIVHVFAHHPLETRRLYFIDLLGAGLGALSFLFILEHFEVARTLIFLSAGAVILGGWILIRRDKHIFAVIMAVLTVLFMAGFKEPFHYAVDPVKGWEWVPGFFKAQDYEVLSSRWHSLGRTDIYKITNPAIRRGLISEVNLTFQLNLPVSPEFAYFSTNFLAGTPVYNYPSLKNPAAPVDVALFSKMVEAPYVLLKDPKVFVIGAGGGRDIFMAATHGATEITGAEINKETFRSMSKGGPVYEYSGRVYDLAKVSNVDGRHLVKTSPRHYYDLIILNGVDTFSGLSSGAYAYAESYLYTKEALMDYLRILKDNGIINFNRWLMNPPRETLRLEAIAFDALKSLDVQDPTRHLMILEQASWSMTLVKKTPFNDDEIQKIVQYAHTHGMKLLYPSEKDQKITNHPFMMFDVYAQNFRENKHKELAAVYPYDISVVTDDAPFFYKYYKFNFEDLLHPNVVRHTGPVVYNGPVVFWTQFLVLVQSFIFILLFIFIPLFTARRTDIRHIPSKVRVPFIVYFACLGMGFMFVEIPLMQKFVLLLGTPIYSISVVLAVLLGWTGLGSFIIDRLPKLKYKNDKGTVLAAASTVMLFIILLISAAGPLLDAATGLPMIIRVLLVALLLAPAGIFLGAFFPLGLKIAGTFGPSSTAWAWALNSGFGVLGSMLAIIIAQFLGFKLVLLVAGLIYFCAVWAFFRLHDHGPLKTGTDHHVA